MQSPRVTFWRSQKVFFSSLLFLTLWLLLSVQPLKAADSLDAELDEIEKTLEREEKSLESDRTERKKKAPKRSLEKLSDLANLAPFQDVAVIQKRFFAKTGRWETFFAGTLVMNDAFFLNGGGALRLGYHFSEGLGVEANVLGLFNGEQQVTKDLGERGVVTESIVTPKLYAGLNLKWLPVYGKMAFEDQKIVPFDLYFTIGGGMTDTNQDEGGSWEPTLHLGTGQSFAFSQSWAFRWDLSWNLFQVDSTDATTDGTYSNLYFTVGLSYYFPEVRR